MVNERITLRDVRLTYNGITIIGAEAAEYTVARDPEPALEGGTHLAVDLVDGPALITGSLTVAWVDNTILEALAPNAATWPFFTLHGTISSGKAPARDITLFDVKLDSFAVQDLVSAAGGWARLNLPFKALSYGI